jgi:hypothetical protein
LKKLFLVVALALLTAAATPEDVSADEKKAFKAAKLRFLAGYRTDDLDWNNAGDTNGENPNILSELSWDDLKISQLRAEGHIDLANDTVPWLTSYLKGKVGYGWIYDGHNRDSDYTADNRASEVSRSINDADDGSVLDLSIAIGPHISFNDDRWSIIPLLGYSHHEQRLTITNGQRVIPPSGPFDGLDSTYETEWSGPWVGADLAYHPLGKWTVTTSIEYHWVDYSAEADWNLRDDFQHPKSFEHEAYGDGWVAGVGVNYALNQQFSLGLSGDYLSWNTDSGTDRLYLANGSIVDTRLNEVNWESKLLSVTLDLVF